MRNTKNFKQWPEQIDTADMLDRATEKKVFEGAAIIRVLQIEDLIGLKVQAIDKLELLSAAA